MPPPEATKSPVSEVLDGAVILGPGGGDRLGGYREVGRFDYVYSDSTGRGGVRGPVTIGDRLVMAASMYIDEDGGAWDGQGGWNGQAQAQSVLGTTDGQTWLPSTVPGSTPFVDDLAATTDYLLAVGGDGTYPDSQARLWASEDGEAWTPLESPPDSALTRVISGADPLAVRSFDWLWIQGVDGEWVKGTRLTNMDILAGPGGYLAWDDRAGPFARAFLMHSTDLLEWDDVDLSASPRLAQAVDVGDIAIYATDEEWIFVPSRSRLPDTIFTSGDGLVWREAPRPPRMDRPSWIAAVGDEVHAFETTENGRDLLWTWPRGESAAPPERAGDRQSRRLTPPVAWQGDWVTLAFRGRSGPNALWRYDGDGGEG
jgi:hypothetical protein